MKRFTANLDFSTVCVALVGLQCVCKGLICFPRITVSMLVIYGVFLLVGWIGRRRGKHLLEHLGNEGGKMNQSHNQ